MHRGERQIYEKTQTDPDLQDRRRTKVLGNARLPDYIDWSKAERARFPNLEPSTTAISICLPLGLLEQIESERRHRISFLYFTRCRIVEILPAFASCPFRILEIAFEQFDAPHREARCELHHGHSPVEL
jgi:hypothetical protein